MTHGFTRRMTIGIGAIGLALLAGPSSADHGWGSYHWARTANPFTLLTGDNVTSAWDSYLNTAISDWSASTVLNLQEVPGAARSKNCRPTAGRIEVCNGNYGQNGWLGIANIWVSGSHITQATTRVNDTYFNSPTYNTPAWRRLVMCQELAHDFGLGHQDEEFGPPNLGSCMDYTSDPDGGGAYGPANEHPDSHDYDMIEEIYAHTDSTSTIGSAASVKGAPAAISQGDLDRPGQWGRLVRSSRNGRVQIYALDFGKGNKIITHVFWADPAADAR